MRRKPSSQNNGGYNQHRKPRYQQGGSSGGDYRSSGQHNHNRPRKNYSAAREKYLAQARDALASGDRVLAENYFQHADHCYRMMVEEGHYNPRPNQAQPQQQAAGEPGAAPPMQDMPEEQPAMQNTNQLPAFLTGGYEQQERSNEPPPVQNWEERDSN